MSGTLKLEYKIMQTNKLSFLLKDRNDLVWWVPEESKENISDEMTLEAVLNYGTWQDVQAAINILGWSDSGSIFSSLDSAKRSNLRPEVRHFFKLYFEKHEPSTTH